MQYRYLSYASVFLNFRTTAADSKNYDTNFYNLDAIISVGYRVNSVRAKQFRQWTTQVPAGIWDKKRLENVAFLGEDYCERLLSEIHKIRLSERSFYQKITDIYATSVDYNKDKKHSNPKSCSLANCTCRLIRTLYVQDEPPL